MYRYIKRGLDIVLSLFGLPLFFLLLVVISPVIYFDDRGPVFYNAPRIGYKGKNFIMYKFRTMVVDAPDIRNADGTTFNSENDPRLTKVGRFLRETSLDETPQIINVLIGNMSFIGPRPDYIGADKELYRPGDIKKLDVRPGITGYSQAYYRNSSTLDQRFDGDLYYVENLSFKLDIKILLRTIKTVFGHEYVYRN